MKATRMGNLNDENNDVGWNEKESRDTATKGKKMDRRAKTG